MDLEGKHVVIIGGSSGMGLATAAGAAAAGAKVTIASSGQSRLDAALAALTRAGGFLREHTGTAAA
jgi:NAD(P)-dependent dehydrogenase (short-subunit alcohol dehydrogenase family)